MKKHTKLSVFQQWLAILALVLAPIFANAHDIDSSNPTEMMKVIANDVFSTIKADQAQIKKNPNLLKSIVKEKMMPYANVKYSALLILAPYLPTAKREDVMTFIEAFDGYLVTSFAQVLTQYTGQEIKFSPSAPLAADAKITGVKLAILQPGKTPINLEFKLRKDSKGNNWKVFDLVAEGVSMISSKQAEWSQQIRKNGIVSAAKMLNDFAKQNIKIESKAK